ncbi:MAG TPA: NAD(P)-dependent oxidoreductase [Ktedonosporobacter sp.]|nr:NAD(P)-dependent oxidoreductase [Ktedonosporobacter sp.]
MHKRIGFIGLGAMGKPMATRLLQAGYEVTVTAHRNQAVVTELVQQGAQQADNPAGVAAQSDVIITMLPDSPDVEEICFGPEGIASGGHPEGSPEGARSSIADKASDQSLVMIDMSTISPLAVRSLAARLQESGITLLDAPVSGGPWRAASGELTIMVGGEASQVEQQRDILDVLGTHIVHAGPVGHGSIVKVANNMIAGMLLPALSEALTLAVKAGVRLDTLREVLATSSGNNYILEHWLPQTLFRENFEGGFALELLRKDIGLALEVGRELDVPLPEAGLTYQLFTQAKGLGYGRQDMTAISKLYQQAANINIVTGQPFQAEI